MFRRLSLLFVFFTSMSAAYAYEAVEYATCDAGCYGLCGMEGVSKASCKRICSC